MLAAGGPNYETALRDTDIHMDSETIPNERYVLCFEHSLDWRCWSLRHSPNLFECAYQVFIFSAYCFMHIARSFPYSMLWYIIHIWYINAYQCIFYIFIALMHLNVFRTIFAHRTCNTAPYLLCQRMYCMQCCWSWSEYLCMKVSLRWQKSPVTRTWLVRPWNWQQSPAEMDGDSRRCTGLIPVDAVDRLAAKPELAEFFFKWLSLRKAGLGRTRRTPQESEQRPAKRAFGRANSGLVFQEAQLIDMHSIHFIHLFYEDKSFSGQQCDSIGVTIQSTVPIEANMQCMQNIFNMRLYVLYANICWHVSHICINCTMSIFTICRNPFEYSWRYAAKPLDSGCFHAHIWPRKEQQAYSGP